ncbi:MAG TPA: hypothetical protein VF544_21315 [Pyrinomonadaceae bacterium]|jgi:hypothetical protein
MYSQKRRNHTVLLFLLLISWAVASLGPAVSAGAAVADSTVRGRIDRQTAAGVVPATYILVRLYREDTKEKMPDTYTGNNGMYYIRNVRPGTYILEVWLSTDKLYKSYRINVEGAPYTDIQTISIVNAG